MEHEVALPCIQQLTTGPYPEPAESSQSPRLSEIRRSFRSCCSCLPDKSRL